MISSTNARKINGIIASIFLFISVLTPTVILAQVQSGTQVDYTKVNPSTATDAKQTGITYECGNGVTAGDCTFSDLVAATIKVTNFGAIFALSFSVVVIAYAGVKFMISGDFPAERTKAKSMLWKVVIGIIVILAAWLIVTLITNALVPGVVQFGL